MAKKYYLCGTAKSYTLLFRYEGMRRDKQYEYPEEKVAELLVTDLERVEPDLDERVFKRMELKNSRRNASEYASVGGTAESPSKYQVPITPKSLEWVSFPDDGYCPDEITAFLMMVKPTSRAYTLPLTKEEGFFCQIGGNPSNVGDIFCVDVPNGTPDSFDDEATIPEQLLKENTIRVSTKVKSSKKEKVNV